MSRSIGLRSGESTGKIRDQCRVRVHAFECTCTRAMRIYLTRAEYACRDSARGPFRSMHGSLLSLDLEGTTTHSHRRVHRTRPLVCRLSPAAGRCVACQPGIVAENYPTIRGPKYRLPDDSSGVSTNVVISIPVFIVIVVFWLVVWLVVGVLVERVLDAFVEDHLRRSITCSP